MVQCTEHADRYARKDELIKNRENNPSHNIAQVMVCGCSERHEHEKKKLDIFGSLDQQKQYKYYFKADIIE